MHPLNEDNNTTLGTPAEKPFLQSNPFVAGNMGTGTTKQIKVTRFLIIPIQKVSLLINQCLGVGDQALAPD